MASARRRSPPASAWGLAAACALAALLSVAPPGAAPGDAGIGEMLLGLADEALAAGELDIAESRYRRVLRSWPRSAEALAGLGRVALARGDDEAARRRFQEAAEADPGDAAGHEGLATLAERAGDGEAARRHLDAALSAEPGNAALHARRLRLTGPAPQTPPAGREAVLERARAHPYDPGAQLAAARVEAAAGRREAAAARLRGALVVADRDPAAAFEAAAELALLEGDAAPGRVVPVHLWADQSVAAREGFRFELRIALGRASRALEPVLDTLFLPVAIRTFDSSDAGDALEVIRASFLRRIGAPPERGILAAFTRRASPRTPLANRNGQATLLGRDLVVRLLDDDPGARTLAHELLHLYGAIHVSDAASIMAPSGGTLALDAHNARIVAATRPRRFGPGGLEAEVLDAVDVSELAEAYLEALAANVRVRNAGLLEALDRSGGSVRAATPELRRAMGQDRHLADVSRVVAWLLLRVDRPADAVAMIDNAARLYGPRTAAGRAAREQADRWRSAYKAFLPPGYER